MWRKREIEKAEAGLYICQNQVLSKYRALVNTTCTGSGGNCTGHREEIWLEMGKLLSLVKLKKNLDTSVNFILYNILPCHTWSLQS